MNVILELDAPLYVDVTCWGCKSRCVMSNTVERDGRRYCYRCALIHELDGDKDRQIEELRKRVAELEQQISVANL